MSDDSDFAWTVEPDVDTVIFIMDPTGDPIARVAGRIKVAFKGNVYIVVHDNEPVFVGNTPFAWFLNPSGYISDAESEKTNDAYA